MFLHAAVLLPALSAVRAAGQLVNDPQSEQQFGPAAACHRLHLLNPDATHFPNTTIYRQDNTDFWSQASALGPACIFAPSCPQDLGQAVKALKELNCPFAMRGGGHMPIADSNNINSTGVLLSSSGFKRLGLAPDGQSVNVGPSNHWDDVYRFLGPHGKTVVGGRLGIVGIPGFVTGGGASFLSAQYGWASNNVKSYTVILADGSVAVASPSNSLSDLFWALRGGGNSFALVTNLELKTYDYPVVTVGIAHHGNHTSPSAYYDALVDYAIEKQVHDEKASIIPVINTGNVAPYNNAISFTTYRFWAGNASAAFNETGPPSLSCLTQGDLAPVSDTFAPKSMNEWSEETAPSFSQTTGLRQRFYTPLTLRVQSREAAVAALHIIHDAYFKDLASQLSELKIWFTGLSPFPVSKRFLEASTGFQDSGNPRTFPEGDPMGVEPENLLVTELSLTYNDDPTYEPIVTRVLQDAESKIRSRMEAEGLADLISPWIYINDADKSQDVFAGYPKDNILALQRIRDKYDPQRVFTDLMPGGWKVADVDVSGMRR